jgi:hypothetical protein
VLDCRFVKELALQFVKKLLDLQLVKKMLDTQLDAQMTQKSLYHLLCFWFN